MNTLQNTDRSRLLTKAQVAEELNVTPRTISNWQGQGHLPHIKINGRCLYQWPELMESLKRNFGRNFQ